MLVEAVVDARRDPAYRFSRTPRQKMGNLRVTMVRMLWGEETSQTEEAIADQVTIERWCPAGVMPIQPPREIGKYFNARATQRDLLDG